MKSDRIYMKCKTKHIFIIFLFAFACVFEQGFSQKPELMVQSGLSENVSGIAVSQDDRYLLVATLDRKVKLYDLTLNTELASLTTAYVVHKMVFTPQPGKIIMVTVTGMVYFVDLLRDHEGCKLVLLTDKYLPYKYFSNEFGDLNQMFFSQNADFLISGNKGKIYFTDLKTMKAVLKIKGELSKSDFKNNKLIYTTDKQKYIILDSFNFSNGEVKRLPVLKIETESVNKVMEAAYSFEDQHLEKIGFGKNADRLKLVHSYNETYKEYYEEEDSEVTEVFRETYNTLILLNIKELASCISPDYHIDEDKFIASEHISFQCMSDFPVIDFFRINETSKNILWLSSGKVLYVDFSIKTIRINGVFNDLNEQNSKVVVDPDLSLKTTYYYSEGIFLSNKDYSLYEKKMFLKNASEQYVPGDDAIFLPDASMNIIKLSFNDSITDMKRVFNHADQEQQLMNIHQLNVINDSDYICFSGFNNILSLINVREGKVVQKVFPDSIMIIRQNYNPADSSIWVIALSSNEFDSIYRQETALSDNFEVFMENTVGANFILYRINPGRMMDAYLIPAFRVRVKTALFFDPRHYSDQFYLTFENGNVHYGISGLYAFYCPQEQGSYHSHVIDSKYEKSEVSINTTVSSLRYNDHEIWGENKAGAFRFKAPDKDILCATFNDKGEVIAAFYPSGIVIRNINTGKVEADFTSCDLGVPSYSFQFFNKSKYLLVGSSDGMILFYDYVKKEVAFRFYFLPGNSWVLINKDGLFDYSGNVDDYLKFIVPDTNARDEYWNVINLKGLKHRYYQPNLFNIALGNSAEHLRNVNRFDIVEFAPKVAITDSDGVFRIDIGDLGGGIGKAALFVDGIEVIENLLADQDLEKKRMEILIPINDISKWIASGKVNRIKVVAFNKYNWLSSESNTLEYTAPESKGAGMVNAGYNSTANPHLYAIVCGVSDYLGNDIDLRYAAKDAEDFAVALQLSAEELFGKDHVNIHVLSSQRKGNELPLKENLLQCFKKISVAGAEDIVVIYISGHGINFGGQDGDFYYLTADAGVNALLLNDPQTRETQTISSREMVNLLNNIPARKKLMIIDACNSGKAAEVIVTSAKDMPASQIRALDRLNERTGFYILSGSASDAVSYETSLYGQGLLTYSLLKAMRGAALRQDGSEEYVDVQTLLQYAVDEVPMLAKGFGGIQMPLFRSPSDQRSFDIGKVNPDIKGKIILTEPKPVFVESRFINSDELYDVLDLSAKVNSRLMEFNSKGNKASMLYLPVQSYPGAFQLSGTYKTEDDHIVLQFIIRKDAQKISDVITLTEKLDDPTKIVDKIIETAGSFIEKH